MSTTNKTLGQQVAAAQAEAASWSPEKRASVRLEGGDGSQDQAGVMPPTRGTGSQHHSSVPAAIQKIGELLRTQDNRYTDQPMFIVQQKRQIVGLDPRGYRMSHFDEIPIRLPSGAKATVSLPRPFTSADFNFMVKFLGLYVEDPEPAISAVGAAQGGEEPGIERIERAEG